MPPVDFKEVIEVRVGHDEHTHEIKTHLAFSSRDPLVIKTTFADEGNGDDDVVWWIGWELFEEAIANGQGGTGDIVITGLPKEFIVYLTAPGGTSTLFFPRPPVEALLVRIRLSVHEEEIATTLNKFLDKLLHE